VAGVVWFSQSGSLARLSVGAQGQKVKVGEPAPDFTLDDLDGKVVHFNDLAGQSVLINFWATWCVDCVEEIPLLGEAYESNKDQGFVVLAVNVEESPTEVEMFLEGMTLTFPVVLDRRGDVAGAYRVIGFPTSVFVDRDGYVVAIHRGPLSSVAIENYLEVFLAP